MRTSLLPGAFAAALAACGLACGDLSSASGEFGGSGEGGFNFGGGSVQGGATGIGGQGAGAMPPGPFNYTALCGVDECVPGELVSTCREPDGTGGAGGEGQGGASEGGAPSSPWTCQVADARGRPDATCAPSGSGIVNGVCNSSADCLPGLGCVLASGGETNEGGGPATPPVGICRPYCCEELEDCAEGTYCAPQPLFDGAAPEEEPRIPIPVCMPIQSCQLLGTDCPEGLTCSIVRADGSTSCVPPGTGALCEPCECAPGFACNFGTGLCFQLCDTSTNDCPGAGAICQGGANLPDRVGICVAGDASCGS